MTAVRELMRERARQERTRRAAGARRVGKRPIPFGAPPVRTTPAQPRGLMTRMEFHKWRMKHDFTFEAVKQWKNTRNGRMEYLGVYATKTGHRARIILKRSELEAYTRKFHMGKLTDKAMGAAMANPHFLKEAVDFFVKLALHI